MPPRRSHLDTNQGARAGETLHLPSGVEFLDAVGVRWRVTERDARRDPGARGDRCLIFACAEAVRRVWDYPAGWRDLSAEGLLALSWRR